MHYTRTNTDDFTEKLEWEGSRSELLAAIAGGDADVWGAELESLPETTDGAWCAVVPCDCGEPDCDEHEASTILIRVEDYDPRDWDGLTGMHCRFGYPIKTWQDLCERGHYAHLDAVINIAHHDAPIFVPSFLSGSDYSGSLVERSNYEAWCENFATGEDVWWTQIPGSHGTYAVAVLKFGAPRAAVEWLAPLEDYPLADESRHSELELEAQDNAWESWARREFLAAIEAEHGREPPEGFDVRALFEDAAEQAGEHWCNEQGVDMYIDAAAVAKGVDPDDLEGWAIVED